MLRMRRENAQLLLIDMQEKLLPPIAERDVVIERCIRLIKLAKRLHVPITVSEHYPQGLGGTLDAVSRELGNQDIVLDKMSFSCIGDEHLRHRLDAVRDSGRGQVIVAGIETHVCVAQTAMDLIVEGYEPFIVADATSSREIASRDLGFDRLRRAGAIIVNSEMVMFEWLEKAGTPEFKDLHPLIK